MASPAFQQVFDLERGHCLDDPDVRLRAHAVRVLDGVVRVAALEPALSAESRISPRRDG